MGQCLQKKVVVCAPPPFLQAPGAPSCPPHPLGHSFTEEGPSTPQPGRSSEPGYHPPRPRPVLGWGVRCGPVQPGTSVDSPALAFGSVLLEPVASAGLPDAGLRSPLSGAGAGERGCACPEAPGGRSCAGPHCAAAQRGGCCSGHLRPCCPRRVFPGGACPSW